MKKILLLVLLSTILSCKSKTKEELDRQYEQRIEDSLKKETYIQDSIARTFALRKKQLTDSLIKQKIDSIVNSN